MVLRVTDLHVSYQTDAQTVPAVRGVSLEVPTGQILGIAGESGSGKTSLALALLRLLPPHTNMTGRIDIDDKDVLTMSFGQLRGLRWAQASIVFQGAMHALNPVQTVGHQVAEPLTIHHQQPPRQARTQAIELLHQVGLPSWRAKCYPHQLSGGQRQRVMIAMALACRPRLIVADEATTALDVMIQAQILDLLTHLVQQQDVAMIMISHDLSILSSTCDTIAVMYAGQIIETGAAAHVFTDPQHPYTRALADSFPSVGDHTVRKHPTGLGGDPPDPTSLPQGCPFHPRCPVAIEQCHHTPPPMRHVSAQRSAACIHLPDTTKDTTT